MQAGSSPSVIFGATLLSEAEAKKLYRRSFYWPYYSSGDKKAGSNFLFKTQMIPGDAR
jgi:hypothetical protein